MTAKFARFHKIFSIAMIALTALAASLALSLFSTANAFGAGQVAPLAELTVVTNAKPSPGMLPSDCDANVSFSGDGAVGESLQYKWVRPIFNGQTEQTTAFGTGESGARYGLAISFRIKSNYTLTEQTQFFVNTVDAVGKYSIKVQPGKKITEQYEEDGYTLTSQCAAVAGEQTVLLVIYFPKQISEVNAGNIPYPVFGEWPQVPTTAIKESLGEGLSLVESESVWGYLNDSNTLYEQKIRFGADLRYCLRMIAETQPGYEIADNATFIINNNRIENGKDYYHNEATQVRVRKNFKVGTAKQFELRIEFPKLTTDKKLAIGGYLQYPAPVTGKTLAQVIDPKNAEIYGSNSEQIQDPYVDFPKETGLQKGIQHCYYYYDRGDEDGNPIRLFNNSVFKEGEKYMVKGYLRLIDGYEFADDFELRVNDTIITKANLRAASNGDYYFVYKFGENKTMNSVSASIVAPVPGKAPSNSATVPSDAGYTAEVRWYPAASTTEQVVGTFKTGVIYKAHVTFTAKNGYTFPNVFTTTATINGKSARFQNHDGTATGTEHRSVTFSQEFASGEGVGANVTTVKVTGVAKPTPGTVASISSIRANAGLQIDPSNTTYFYIDPSTGSRRTVENGTTFQEGTQYGIRIAVLPQTGFILYEYAPMSVNGVPVTAVYVRLGSKGNIHCDYDFSEKVPTGGEASGGGTGGTTADGTSTATSAKDSEAAVEKAILNATSDEGPAGTSFIPLRAKATKIAKTSFKLSWAKVSGAVKYKVYGNKCGKSTKYKLKKTTTSTSITPKKLKKGTYYKYLVAAIDSKGRVISMSKAVHVCTTGGKYTNYKSVKTAAKKNKVTIKKGKTFKLKATGVRYATSKTVKKHRGMKYLSSNNSIATVSSKGTITGKKKGTCYVYAYTQSGTCTKVRVTVK